MTKVLLITNDFPPMVGGIARWYERICATVPPKCVLVLAPRVPGDLGFDAQHPYRVVRRWVPTRRHPLARVIQMAIFLSHAIRIARSERVDAVHIGQLHLGLIALVLKMLLRAPYVLYLHGGELAAYMRFRAVRAVARTIVRNACTVVVNSKYTLRSFEAMGICHPHIEILTMSVPTERFHPNLDIRQIRARYGLNGQKIILTVGRLVERKGHDMVIRVLPRVRQSVGPIRYLIVGCGPEEHRLRALAGDIGCSEETIFVGYIPENELPSFYAACDVFAMPSRALAEGDFEGFGIVFLEAGACGKPVVGGRSGGIAEAVIDGVTGILVNPTDAGELSDALIRLLVDRKEAVRLGLQGRLRTEQLGPAWRATLTTMWSH